MIPPRTLRRLYPLRSCEGIIKRSASQNLKRSSNRARRLSNTTRTTSSLARLHLPGIYRSTPDSFLAKTHCLSGNAFEPMNLLGSLLVALGVNRGASYFNPRFGMLSRVSAPGNPSSHYPPGHHLHNTFLTSLAFSELALYAMYTA